MLFGVLALTAGVGLMTYAICRMCDADPHSATDWALLSAMAAAAACAVATTVTAELSYNYRLRQKQQLQPPEPEQYRLW